MHMVDPYDIPEHKWVDNVALWPPVDYGEIYHYLIETPGPFTREKMKAHKSLDAFNYYIRYCQDIVSDISTMYNCAYRLRRVTFYCFECAFEFSVNAFAHSHVM